VRRGSGARGNRLDYPPFPPLFAIRYSAASSERLREVRRIFGKPQACARQAVHPAPSWASRRALFFAHGPTAKCNLNPRWQWSWPPKRACASWRTLLLDVVLEIPTAPPYPYPLEVVVREKVLMEDRRFLLKLLTAEAIILIAVYIVLASI
jgi:hypothetical protein